MHTVSTYAVRAAVLIYAALARRASWLVTPATREDRPTATARPGQMVIVDAVWWTVILPRYLGTTYLR